MATPPSIAAARRERFDTVTALLDAFASQHLDAEITGFVHTLWLRICRRKDDACQRGQPAIWAAAVTHVIARMNFLFDSSQPGHLTFDTIVNFYGTNKTTTGGKASQIERALKLSLHSEPGLCRRQHLETFTNIRHSSGLIFSFAQAKQLGYLPPDLKVEDLL